MKRTWIVVLVAVALVACSWTLWQAIRRPPQKAPEPAGPSVQPHRVRSLADLVQVARRGQGPPPAVTPVVAGTKPVVLPEAIERLLARPGQVAKMREVPPLEPGTVAELLRRYAATGSVTNKYQIARILIFAGKTELVPAILNTLTNEYRGKTLTLEEIAKLSDLPMWLGLLAATDDRTFEFLVHSCSVDFWESIKLGWRSNDQGADSRLMAGRSLQGLGLSNRAEVWQFFEELRADPVRAAEEYFDFTGAIVDSAYVRDLIQEHGLQRAMDDYLYDPQVSRAFSVWWKTPNGVQWMDWYMEVGRERVKRQAGSQ